ncbi:secreted RxLR effector protein 161-like [Dioscorea cayenensis subsp. rotundata]|uniref:Secreted RxLR effector protein 161-like n=1 Tax=Dioscorea cayennensis subsp. rotundata TaxID=55577 RepID=A0AB40AVF4_DIOCR|nr:secreted RxLR effector protein 161-like [Dioscorea cayenensis subsp. rotundata]
MKTFEMSDLRLIKYFLGLEVIRTKKRVSVRMSTKVYSGSSSQKWEMLNCKSIDNLMNSNEKLHSQDNSGDANPLRYRLIVGGTLYRSYTSPDIMHAVSMVFRFMQSPSMHHLGVVKRILRYINGTVNYGIYHDKNEEFKLLGHPNSDEGAQDDQKSTTGWVFSLGFGVVAWCSKKQPITALSSTEAECISVTAPAYEAVWAQMTFIGP